MPRERGSDGRFVEGITYDDVKDILVQSEKPALSAAEIADELDWTRQAVDSKLRKNEGSWVVREEHGGTVLWRLRESSGPYILDQQIDHAVNTTVTETTCYKCNIQIGDGDDVAALLEYPGPNTGWKLIDTRCPGCANNAETMREESRHETEITVAMNKDYPGAYAFVEGYFKRTGEAAATIADVTVREVYR